MVKAVHGWDASFDDLREIGKTILLAEVDFNRRAGFTKAHDRLPQFMYEEKLAPTGAVYDITEETAAKLYDFSG